MTGSPPPWAEGFETAALSLITITITQLLTRHIYAIITRNFFSMLVGNDQLVGDSDTVKCQSSDVSNENKVM